FARARPLSTAAVALAVAVSLAAQLTSLRLLQAKQAYSVRLAEAVARHPREPIATRLFWVPPELLREFFARPIFLVGSAQDLRELALRLRRAGHRSFLFATGPDAASAGTLVERIEDRELRFYGIDLVRVELP